MYITKKHLSRRTMLRGMGVTMALPLLEAMVPARTAFAKTAAGKVRLAAIEMVGHGDLDPNGTTGAWAGEIGQVQMLPRDIIASVSIDPARAPVRPNMRSLSRRCTSVDGKAVRSRIAGQREIECSEAEWAARQDLADHPVLHGLHDDRQPPLPRHRRRHVRVGDDLLRHVVGHPHEVDRVERRVSPLLGGRGAAGEEQ